MKNSQKLLNKIKEDKNACLAFTFGSVMFVTFLFIKILNSICNTTTTIIICSIIDVLILIIGLQYFKNVGKLPENEKDKIYYELDNKLEKVFNEYNLYITNNYIVSINTFKLFVIPIKDIQAIDTHQDSRYYYKYYYTKRGKGYRRFIDYMKASILTKIMRSDDSNIYIFNIICDKKIYNVTTSSGFNKQKLKQIDEMAEYICNKNNHIDWI